MPILGVIASSKPGFSLKTYYFANQAGQLYSSTDYVTWSFVGQPVYSVEEYYYYLNELDNVIYSANGEPTTQNFSTDGITWTAKKWANTFGYPLIKGGNSYLGSLQAGYAYSTDGNNWTFGILPVNPPSSINLYGGPPLVYGDSKFVVVGDATAARIATSTNGTTWTTRTSPHGATISYYAIAHSGSVFVAVGQNDNDISAAIASSTDGITWTSRTTPYGATANRPLFAIAYGNGKFVTGAHGTGFAYSTDGTTWTGVAVAGAYPARIAYGNGYYAAVDPAGSGLGTLWYSTDAVTWSTTTPIAGKTFYGLVYSTTTSKWHISTNDITKYQGYSTNLTTWSWVSTGEKSRPLGSLAYANSLFVAGSNTGNILTSTDAITWTNRISISGVTTLTKVAYLNSLWVAVGASACLHTSTNAITWTSRTSGFGTSTIWGIDYGTSVYAIAGNSALLSTSTDAVTWTSRTSGFTASTINDIKYINNGWIIVGASGKIATSTDAITWTLRTSNTTSGLQSVYYGNGLYVVAGAGGTIRTSTDTITWTTRTTAVTGVASRQVYYDSTAGWIIWMATYGDLTVTGKINYMNVSTDGITWTSRALTTMNPWTEGFLNTAVKTTA